MVLITSRFAALLLAALSLGFSWSHLMELGARLKWSPDLWIQSTVFGGLYAEYGRLGAVVELLAIIALLVHWLVDRNGAGSILALTAFGLFAIGLCVWLIGVLPMNGILATWLDSAAGGQIPDEFETVSRQWEYSHAAIAALKLAGFMALAGAVIHPGHG